MGSCPDSWVKSSILWCWPDSQNEHVQVLEVQSSSGKCLSWNWLVFKCERNESITTVFNPDNVKQSNTSLTWGIVLAPTVCPIYNPAKNWFWIRGTLGKLWGCKTHLMLTDAKMWCTKKSVFQSSNKGQGQAWQQVDQAVGPECSVPRTLPCLSVFSTPSINSIPHPCKSYHPTASSSEFRQKYFPDQNFFYFKTRNNYCAFP